LAEFIVPSPFDCAEIRAILLDIEGTTTPIDFVFKTLFPFASAHCEDFLRRHFRESEIATLIAQLREASERDAAQGAPSWAGSASEPTLASAATYVRWLTAKDSKITALKTLQGKIWQEGFQRGDLKGEVYPDVAPAFARWKAQGRRIAIFSSGSVLAQKLLFAHSTAGNLSAFLEAYFDTTIGPKRDAASYEKIAAALQLQTETVLFISDVETELDAARAAGMRTALSLRPGIQVPEKAIHGAIYNFE
jgi:enolase-phosphatase E1